VNLGSTAELDEFRSMVRGLIAEHAPRVTVRAGYRSPDNAAEDRQLRDWRARLYASQALGAHWPVEWGGLGLDDARRDLVVAEELARAHLPPLSDQTHLAAFAIIKFGSPAQQARFLPRIRESADVWCQLFSEPGAGSDLAAISTRARADGAHFIVDGQKVWSSNAQWAELGFLIARTDPNSKRHQGLSAFAIDMQLPGIEIREIREITGTSDFNEVFFDGVEMPKDALIGELGDGWRVAMGSLEAERSGIGAGAARLREQLTRLIKLAERSTTESGRPALADDSVRQQLGEFAAQVEICNLLVQQRISRAEAGRSTAADIPVGKLVYSELNLAMAEFALSLEGESALLVEGDSDAVDDGSWQDEYLYARTYTIAGGASEIMRNVIAERALGMPREPRP
jgi:alkylation response protein AidB-like acyl-CoA dehydrogenase